MPKKKKLASARKKPVRATPGKRKPVKAKPPPPPRIEPVAQATADALAGCIPYWTGKVARLKAACVKAFHAADRALKVKDFAAAKDLATEATAEVAGATGLHAEFIRHVCALAKREARGLVRFRALGGRRSSPGSRPARVRPTRLPRPSVLAKATATAIVASIPEWLGDEPTLEAAFMEAFATALAELGSTETMDALGVAEITLRSAAQLRCGPCFEAYTRNRARQRALTMNRSRARQGATLEKAAGVIATLQPKAEPSPLQRATEAELFEATEAILNAMNPAWADAFRAHVLDGIEGKTYAHQEGVVPSAVTYRVAKAREEIGRKLRQRGFGPGSSANSEQEI